MKYQTGGTAALERVMEAYGFRFRNDLCRQIDTSSSTLSTWIKKDYLPGEVLIQCAIETGASIEWLATGNGVSFEHTKSDIAQLQSYVLNDGQLRTSGKILFDLVLMPTDTAQPFAIKNGDTTFILDTGFSEFTDGEWLINIDGKSSIREIAFIPGKRVKVNGNIPFECPTEEIDFNAKVIGVYTRK